MIYVPPFSTTIRQRDVTYKWNLLKIAVTHNAELASFELKQFCLG